MKKLLARIERVRAENFFLAIGLLFGVSTALITPPFQSPDEPNHFARAFQVSEGGFLSERRAIPKDAGAIPYEYINSPARRQDPTVAVGGDLPVSVAAAFEGVSKGLEYHADRKHELWKTISQMNQPLQGTQRTFFHFSTTAVYAPVPYLAQSAGITLGRIADLSPLALMFLGRLANLLAWLFVVYFAIKVSPFNKHVLLLLALMPMSIFLASSLNTDACVNCFSFLLFATTLRYAYYNEELTSRDYLLLFCTALVLSLSKMAYIPLVWITFLIPLHKTSRKKFHYLAVSTIVCICSLAGIAWVRAVSDFYVPYLPFCSLTDQLHFIIDNPLEYLKVFAGVAKTPGINLLYQYIGELGWLDTWFPKWYYALYLCILVGAAVSNPCSAKKRTAIDFLVILLSLTASFMLVVTAVYLCWTPVGFDSVPGVQGRYLAPLGPFLVFLISRKFTRFTPPYRNTILYLFAFFSLSYMQYTLVARYYIP